MTTANYEVLIGQTPDGFVAVCADGPYFCLEASSEAEATEKAKRALQFYHKRQVAPARPLVKRTLNTFFPIRRIPMGELVAA